MTWTDLLAVTFSIGTFVDKAHAPVIPAAEGEPGPRGGMGSVCGPWVPALRSSAARLRFGRDDSGIGRPQGGGRTSSRRVASLALVLVLALLALTVADACAQARKPRVPPGVDPGGEAVAIAAPYGIDYTVPEIARRLARDGEGELIGWDFVDDDRRPFEPSAADPVRSGTALARTVLEEAPVARLAPFLAKRGNTLAHGRLIVAVARGPARILLFAATSTDKSEPDDPDISAAHFCHPGQSESAVSARAKRRDPGAAGDTSCPGSLPDPRSGIAYGGRDDRSDMRKHRGNQASEWAAFAEAATHFKALLIVVPAEPGAITYPAALDLSNVISVAAHEAVSTTTPHQSRASPIDIAVPSNGNGAHVAAARIVALAARLQAADPRLAGAALKARILTLAKRLPAPHDKATRHGWIAEPNAH